MVDVASANKRCQIKGSESLSKIFSFDPTVNGVFVDRQVQANLINTDPMFGCSHEIPAKDDKINKR